MKKLMLSIVSFIFFIHSAFAANNQNILYYVDGLYSNAESVKDNLRQQSTLATNSCGPTSLLFIDAHFSIKNTGVKPNYTENIANAQDKLRELYSNINQGYNTTTSLTKLRSIARNNWGWTKVYRMSSASGIDTNVNNLINYINLNIPALVVLDSSYSGNPVSGSHGIDHIVIVYAYQKRQDSNGYGASSPYNNRQNDRIYFYDPYYGGNGYFTRAEIPTAVDLAGFAFLTVAT